MSSRTKKPVKYPRKLRQKLEKVAAERDARTYRDPDDEPPDDGVDFWWTFYRSFHGSGSVYNMSSRLDAVLRRFTTTSYMLPSGVDRIMVDPPWAPAEPDASS